eukprot:IDg5422t1
MEFIVSRRAWRSARDWWGVFLAAYAAGIRFVCTEKQYLTCVTIAARQSYERLELIFPLSILLTVFVSFATAKSIAGLQNCVIAEYTFP